jgi:ABC-type branched-subunit amino acid transport system ATPase component
MPPPLLEVTGVDVWYGSVQVLHGVDLEVHPGETVALLGTNGAGKSTVLKAISGLLPVRRGTVHFDGRDLTAARPEQRVDVGIVQLSGGNALFPSLSVAENLRLAAFPFLGDNERVERTTDAVLDLFPEIASRLGQRAGSLSGGEQQIVAVAKALIPEPRLLIIDELTLGLAPIMVQRLLEAVDELRGRRLSMLIVEQSLNVALSFADRALFMERGQVRFDGDPRRLAEEGDLVRAVFLGGGS